MLFRSTLAVQVGFVVGALASAILGIADAVPARRLFVMSALGGAAVNAAFVLQDAASVSSAIGLRALTGVALAGVYPSGLKAMAGWFSRGRGMALGVLVGALTVGSAGPHLIRGLGFEWKAVVIGASLLAVVGAVVMQIAVRDGPFEVSPTRFSWRHIGAVARNPGVRLSTYG